MVICGYKGSTAEDAANNYGYKFEEYKPETGKTLKKVNGKWCYYVDGKFTKATTLVNYNGSNYYYVKGGIKTNVTGNIKIGFKTYKIKNGVYVR